jgi:hypothetical protein
LLARNDKWRPPRRPLEARVVMFVVVGVPAILIAAFIIGFLITGYR